ncbi:M1 family metallopeptidase [Pedobacter sp. ASV1-7]|uniref:M1 family metallopeptidase n=1 Tax=Pedobacter sp. ASV1-7 TaxID=3145237 RepID=UPI0032E9354C
MTKNLVFFIVLIFSTNAFAQHINNPGSNHGNKFEQLGTIISDPNIYRSASGAPGPAYWQQRADYEIDAELDEKNLRLNGSETITYYNNSPDPLSYLWVQLDENQHKASSDNKLTERSKISKQMDYKALNNIINPENNLGVQILKVTDEKGTALPYTINNTMMRIDLPSALQPKQKYKLRITWNYNIANRMIDGGRGGYEYFAEDDNYLFTITQWFPRMAVYSDFQGWQNKQFEGRGEFALAFGNYKVNMTLPADHVVGATGECQNYAQVLSSTSLKRWNAAQTAKAPIEIINLSEVQSAISKKSSAKKTWTYTAENVRDFAWVSSRRLVWDAMATHINGKKIMSMSYYGPEAYPLYNKYSTKVVDHTLREYSKHTIPYPYPVAISVEAANGMEYPMICFNYGRAEKDGTYTEAIKHGMISVIIHEVGHNFFPMIVNSDERQWSWMDEGLNTFCQYLTEQAWDNNYPSQRGPAHKITDYMKMPKDQLEPIMTNSENIINFGPNAYAKPATALNILRETVMGRTLFDYAFKEYAKRWAFKHPTPADLFRTMEDASAVDLDWFWRGWFFGTDPVDISLNDVRYHKMDSLNVANESKKNFYELDFSNIGGLVMPIIIEWTFVDGSKEIDRIPAYIWRKDENKVTKVFAKDKEVRSVQIDPYRETADIDESNNSWPRQSQPTRFELFKKQQAPRGSSAGTNPTQQSRQR